MLCVCLCVFPKLVFEGGDPVSAARFLGVSVVLFSVHMCVQWEELTLDRCHVVHINTHGEKHIRRTTYSTCTHTVLVA